MFEFLTSRLGVGKSCLLLRFCDDRWTPLIVATIGIDFKIRTIELDGKHIKLQIWDTSGLERFRTITTAYYRGAMGILLVYDVTNERSFNNIRNWHANVGQHASEGVNKILIGNKSDWTDKRAVTEDQGRALAEELDMKFMETSVKANEGVEEAFFALASDCKARIDSQADAEGGASDSNHHLVGFSPTLFQGDTVQPELMMPSPLLSPHSILTIDDPVSSSEVPCHNKTTTHSLMELFEANLFIDVDYLLANIVIATKSPNGLIDWIELNPEFHGSLVKCVLRLVSRHTATFKIASAKEALFPFLINLLNGRDSSTAFFDRKKMHCDCRGRKCKDTGL
ncbi:hypothetical protein AZE42_07159 [Rhizopogon vesiculosus]|uniref:Uncharacterized protein n=1 Tax=Rhizopogon vesiculosus TaxID=180088 RepID=A0A1J8PVM7_9AGAM|nr:hypothetical protein AZE42_07159 [Rhizopogon vesiculosus]